MKATLRDKKKKTKNKIIPAEKISEKLNLKQELFCQLYTKNSFLFGNATLSYAEAYGFNLATMSKEDVVVEVMDEILQKMVKRKVDHSPFHKANQVCSTAGERLLRNVYINQRIQDLLNETMNDRDMDAEIAYTARQREDMTAKMSAIKEYNKIKQRVTAKIDHTTLGKEIQVITGMEIIKEPKKNEDTVQV